MLITKYAIKIGGQLFPKGTRLRLATALDIRQIWPAMAPNEDSEQTVVWFPGVSHPTVVQKSQVERLHNE